MYKVFLVDDEIVIREGVRNTFPWSDDGFTLCGEAPDGEIALSMVQELRPDILVTDIRMPFMDGLALCREVTRSMPWVHIVILSGYDDFAYAREAISLGVKDYLLKPVGAQTLEETLSRIARTIDAERARQADLSAMRRQLASSNRYLQERLLHGLMEGLYTDAVLAEARTLRMNLTARQYAAVVVDVGAQEQLLPLQAIVERLAEGAGGTVHQAVRGGQMVLLVLGDTVEDLEERAYAFAQAIRHEMERAGAGAPSIAIGAAVGSLKDLSRSLESAQSVAQSIDARSGRILSVSDVGLMLPDGLMQMEVVPLYERLLYAAKPEVPAIVQAYFESLGGMAVQSVLIANYMIVDTLLAGMRIIKQAGGDPNQVLPEALNQASLLQSLTTHEEVLGAARDILSRALAYRDENSRSRYGETIRRALRYIEENYARSEITLHDVASHVALSGNHFCTVFSQEVGSTFIEHLTRLRMQRAKEYLKTTDLRSSEIADRIGYNDGHYFGYLFKRHIGMSPRDYRNSCRRGAAGK